jgi:hypothetical protein
MRTVVMLLSRLDCFWGVEECFNWSWKLCVCAYAPEDVQETHMNRSSSVVYKCIVS